MNRGGEAAGGPEWCPYPGLAPFDGERAHVFFGRDAHIEAIIARLARRRFLSVLGPSGVGKSSLVMAGVLPRLEAGMVNEVEGRWRILRLRPGTTPVANLLDGARRVLVPDADPGRLAEVDAMFASGADGLASAALVALDDDESLLVFVDQFEELFRFRGAGSGRRGEAERFVRLLLDAAAVRAARVYVLVTMRSEFLGECAALPGLTDAVNEGGYLLSRLRRREIEQIIAGPARLSGAEVEPALLQRILREVGADVQDLPTLQHALRRAWWQRARTDCLDVGAWDAVGGLTGALNAHAEALVAGLDAASTALLPRVMRRLAWTDASGNVVRDPATLGACAEAAGLSRGDWRRVAGALAPFRATDAAFLVPEPAPEDGPDTLIDLNHEVVARQWRRFAEWILAEADDARRFRMLRDRARDHANGQGDLLAEGEISFMKRRFELTPRNEDWLRRVGGSRADLALVENFVERSDLVRTRERRMSLALFAGLFTIAVLLALVASYEYRALAKKAEDFATVAAETSDSQQKATDAQAKLDALQAELDDAKKEVDVYTGRVSELESFAVQADAAAKDAKTDTQRKIALDRAQSFREAAAKAQSAKDDADARVTAIEAQNQAEKTRNQTELAALYTKLQSLEAGDAALQAQLDAFKLQHLELSNKLDAATQEAAGLKGSLAECRDKLSIINAAASGDYAVQAAAAAPAPQ